MPNAGSVSTIHTSRERGANRLHSAVALTARSILSVRSPGAVQRKGYKTARKLTPIGRGKSYYLPVSFRSPRAVFGPLLAAS